MQKRNIKVVATDEKGRTREYGSAKQARDRLHFRIDHLIDTGKKDRHGRTWNKVSEATNV